MQDIIAHRQMGNEDEGTPVVSTQQAKLLRWCRDLKGVRILEDRKAPSASVAAARSRGEEDGVGWAGTEGGGGAGGGIEPQWSGPGWSLEPGMELRLDHGDDPLFDEVAKQYGSCRVFHGRLACTIRALVWRRTTGMVATAAAASPRRLQRWRDLVPSVRVLCLWLCSISMCVCCALGLRASVHV